MADYPTGNAFPWPISAMVEGFCDFTKLIDKQLNFWKQLPSLSSGIDSDSTDRQSIKFRLSEFQSLLDAARSGGADQDFYQALNALANNGPKIERAIVAWVDLIEVLVQFQEQRFGPRAGLGPLKAAEVKRVLQILLRDQHLPLPGVPDYLVPLVMDYAVDWIVSAVVSVANEYGLWETAPEREGFPLRVFLGKLRLALANLARPFARAAVNGFLWLKHAFEAKVLLGPEITAAIAAVQRDGTIMNSESLIRDVTRLFEWAMSHTKQISAGVQLVFAAVQEAEKYASLSGDKKKEYATSLVFAVLDELGFEQKAGLLFAVSESMVSTTVESAVSLFNKRGVFASSAGRSPAQAA